MLINIFGKRGSGKTTLIAGNLNEFPAPVIVVDILGNFANDDHDQTESLQESIYLAENYYLNPKEQNPIIILQTPDPDLAVEFISATLWELAEKYGHGGTLVLDEVDSISYSKGSCFDQLIRYGRNKGINLITGCRRPAEISRNITAGANKIYIFQTQEPRDVEYFEKTLLGDRAEKLMSLKKHHGLLLDYDREEMCVFSCDVDGNVKIIQVEPINTKIGTDEIVSPEPK